MQKRGPKPKRGPGRIANDRLPGVRCTTHERRHFTGAAASRAEALSPVVLSALTARYGAPPEDITECRRLLTISGYDPDGAETVAAQMGPHQLRLALLAASDNDLASLGIASPDARLPAPPKAPRELVEEARDTVIPGARGPRGVS